MLLHTETFTLIMVDLITSVDRVLFGATFPLPRVNTRYEKLRLNKERKSVMYLRS